MAAQAWRAGRTRYRDLADLDRNTARLSARAHREGQGLRSGRPRRGAPQRALPDERRRPLPACRPGRPEPQDFRLPQRAALCQIGKDYEGAGRDAAPPNAPYPMKGVGPFLHVDPDDRTPKIFACRNALHFARSERITKGPAATRRPPTRPTR